MLWVPFIHHVPILDYMQFPQCVGTRRALIPAGQSAHCVSPVPGTAPGIQQVLSKYLLSGWMNIIPNQLQDSRRHGSLSFTFASTWSLARSILWWRWLIVTIITSANIFKAPPCQALCFICSISFNPPNNSERHTPLLSQFKETEDERDQVTAQGRRADTSVLGSRSSLIAVWPESPSS